MDISWYIHMLSAINPMVVVVINLGHRLLLVQFHLFSGKEQHGHRGYIMLYPNWWGLYNNGAIAIKVTTARPPRPSSRTPRSRLPRRWTWPWRPPPILEVSLGWKAHRLLLTPFKECLVSCNWYFQHGTQMLHGAGIFTYIWAICGKCW